MTTATPTAKPKKSWRRWLVWLAAILSLIVLSITAAWFVMLRMPGERFTGPLPTATEREEQLAAELKTTVVHLATTIGERNLNFYSQLERARQYVRDEFTAAGLQPQEQKFQVSGVACYNIDAELKGTKTPVEIVLIGAHYDSARGTPGANDNASGVAVLLALARHFGKTSPGRTIRFVAFTNEEPPYFQKGNMGSLHYARRCRQRNENLVAMLSLETMGYYRDEPNTQHYPDPLGYAYPSEGNFIGVIGNVGSRKLVRRVVESFRRQTEFPCEGGAVPGDMKGVGWSDHWSFWQEDYSGVMITDTAPFRYPYYHTPEDTPDRIDYERLARVTAGLQKVIAEFGDVPVANAQ